MPDNDNNRSKPNSLLGRVQACKLIQTNSASLTCLVEHAVVDSFLSVFFTLVGGLGGVCFEVSSYWAKVEMLLILSDVLVMSCRLHMTV